MKVINSQSNRNNLQTLEETEITVTMSMAELVALVFNYGGVSNEQSKQNILMVSSRCLNNNKLFNELNQKGSLYMNTMANYAELKAVVLQELNKLGIN